jgi:hypothetical protein
MHQVISFPIRYALLGSRQGFMHRVSRLLLFGLNGQYFCFFYSDFDHLVGFV